MAGHVAHPGHEAGLSGGTLLYAPAVDRHLETMAELADRGLLLLLNMQRPAYNQRKGISEEMASQITREAFS